MASISPDAQQACRNFGITPENIAEISGNILAAARTATALSRGFSTFDRMLQASLSSQGQIIKALTELSRLSCSENAFAMLAETWKDKSKNGKKLTVEDVLDAGLLDGGALSQRFLPNREIPEMLLKEPISVTSDYMNLWGGAVIGTDRDATLQSVMQGVQPLLTVLVLAEVGQRNGGFKKFLSPETKTPDAPKSSASQTKYRAPMHTAG